MTSATYWRRFYRHFNWDAAWKNRCDGMERWLRMEKTIGVKPPPIMVAMNARMLLEAHYRGRWRAVWNHFTWAFWSHWNERYSDKWEWVRTKIFRRPRNPDLVEIERMDEEDRALDELYTALDEPVTRA